MKLAVRFSFLFMLVSVLSTSILGYFSFQNSKSIIEKEIVSHLTSINILKESELKSWISDKKNSIELLAASPYFKDEFAEMIVQHDPENPVHLLMHKALKEGYFFPFIERENFTELFIIRQDDGIVLISTDNKQEGKYKADMLYFIHGKTETFVQNVYYSVSLQQPAMTISAPLKGRNDNLIAVLAGNVDLADLSEIIGRMSGLHETEDTYLVNKFNFFITDPKFGKGYALNKAVFTDGVEAALKHQDGFALYDDYRGEPVIGVFHWIPEVELAIITEINQVEVYAPVYKLRNNFIFLAIGVALSSILAGLLVSINITKPINRLVEGVRELGKGNLNYRLDIRKRDEVGILAAEFSAAEEKLRKTIVSRDELIKEVSRREIIEKELIRSNADLERFVYVASHDLQEPLRMISSYLLLLEKRYRDKLDGDAHDFISFAVEGVRRMHQLINDLLTYSRVEKHAEAFKNVDMESVLEHAIANSRAAITESKAEITHDVLPKVVSSETHLIQVMQNLIANAIKFSGKNIPAIHISAKHDKSRNEWIFSVKDNGIGIDPQYFDRIFTMFQRLHGYEYPGTGMGLAIVKRIIEYHGGRVWVESEPDRGSTFYFTIPELSKTETVKI